MILVTRCKLTLRGTETVYVVSKDNVVLLVVARANNASGLSAAAVDEDTYVPEFDVIPDEAFVLPSELHAYDFLKHDANRDNFLVDTGLEISTVQEGLVPLVEVKCDMAIAPVPLVEAQCDLAIAPVPLVGVISDLEIAKSIVELNSEFLEVVPEFHAELDVQLVEKTHDLFLHDAVVMNSEQEGSLPFVENWGPNYFVHSDLQWQCADEQASVLDMKTHSLRDCSDLKRATAIDAYAAYKEKSLPDTLLGEANIQEGSLRLSLFGSLEVSNLLPILRKQAHAQSLRDWSTCEQDRKKDGTSIFSSVPWMNGECSMPPPIDLCGNSRYPQLSALIDSALTVEEEQPLLMNKLAPISHYAMNEDVPSMRVYHDTDVSLTMEPLPIFHYDVDIEVEFIFLDAIEMANRRTTIVRESKINVVLTMLVFGSGKGPPDERASKPDVSGYLLKIRYHKALADGQSAEGTDVKGKDDEAGEAGMALSVDK